MCLWLLVDSLYSETSVSKIIYGRVCFNVTLRQNYQCMWELRIRHDCGYCSLCTQQLGHIIFWVGDTTSQDLYYVFCQIIDFIWQKLWSILLFQGSLPIWHIHNFGWTHAWISFTSWLSCKSEKHRNICKFDVGLELAFTIVIGIKGFYLEGDS